MEQEATTIRIRKATTQRINNYLSWGSWDAKLNYVLDIADQWTRAHPIVETEIENKEE